MIYILTLVLILYFVIRFDINGQTGQKELFYKILLVWFIAVSGLAYNIGADTPTYMYEYDDFRWSDIHSWGDLTLYRHRQPGWVLVNLLCHLFSNNFLFFKLVFAIFLNIVVFKFIKKYCPYVFSGVLLYAVMLYLNLNFNTLRQSYSFAFFLLGFDFFVEKKWVKYYFFAVIAFLFHSSASICFLFPLLQIIKINQKNLIIVFSVIVVLFLGGKVFFMGLFQNIFNNLMLSSDSLAEEYGDLGNKYITRYVKGELSLFGYIETIIKLAFGFFIVYYNWQNRKGMFQTIGFFSIMFLVFRVLNSFIPVLFFRLMFYVQPFYIISLCVFCMDFCNSYFSKKTVLIPVIVLLLICSTPIQALFNTNNRSGTPEIVQFYPYYSVFNPQIYWPRAQKWGWHE